MTFVATHGSSEPRRRCRALTGRCPQTAMLCAGRCHTGTSSTLIIRAICGTNHP